jgi:hypothetical protein
MGNITQGRKITLHSAPFKAAATVAGSNTAHGTDICILYQHS